MPAVLLLSNGCSPVAPPAAAPAPASYSCALGESGAQPDSISILLDRGAGPEFVADQSFETLIRIDCEGNLVPGLAQSWQASGNGSWRVSLREGVHFWGGESVTANSVLESWSAARADPLRSTAPVLAGSSQIIDEHTLLVRPPSGDISTLADRRLAVIAPGSDGRDEGTGAFRALGDATPQNDWTLVPTAASADRPVLRVAETSAAAMRDSLDAGAEIVVSTDASVARYGAESPSVTERLLPWSRRYLLIIANPLEMASVDSAAFAELGAGLASDAVRADARSAYPYTEPGNLDECLATIDKADDSSSPAEPPTAEISYDRADPVARAIAERLVALSTINGGQSLGALRHALAPHGERLATRDLSRPAFASTLATRSSVAFVLPLALHGAGHCSDAGELFRAAPWLTVRPGSTHFLPLVDVRAALMVRQGAPSLVIGGGGSLLVAPIARPTTPMER